MSFITTDYSNLEENNYGALPTGNYEMIINKAHEDATPSGAETLKIDLIVRNDVQNVPALAETNGKYANRYVFMDNWKRKATNEYDLKNFQYILKAVGVKEGTPINSIDDFINAITRKPVKVYVKKEVDSYNTTDPQNPVYENRVAPWNFSETDFKTVNHNFDKTKDSKNDNPFENAGFDNSNDPFEKNENVTEISDDDLPF